jgi:hypothetical protein
MLSADERAEFEARGLVCLRAAVDPMLADALRARVQAFVERNGLIPKSPPPGFTVTASKTASIWQTLGFADVWGARVLGALDEGLGRDAWHVPKQAGQLLAMANPLHDARWDVPAKVWHLDYMAPGAARGLPGLQVFLCLDTIEPGAGGTLVAAGVHRFIDAIRRREGPDWPGRSADVRAALRREIPWVRALCTFRPAEDRIARFMATRTRVEGGELQVVELTGEPGDVWVMHPWMLHAPAPSCGSRPRMALTERIRTRSALG